MKSSTTISYIKIIIKKEEDDDENAK